MGFFDFVKTGKRDKFELKKPLSEPIAGIAGLPPLDPIQTTPSISSNSMSSNQGTFQSGFNQDFNQNLGVPSTPSIEIPLSEKENKYRMPDFEQQQDFRGSGESHSYSGGKYTSNQYSPAQSSNNSPIEKDIQIISSKLDYLKAMLENMNHRLEALERIARGDEEEVKW
jgi:hypothetical protein